MCTKLQYYFIKGKLCKLRTNDHLNGGMVLITTWCCITRMVIDRNVNSCTTLSRMDVGSNVFSGPEKQPEFTGTCSPCQDNSRTINNDEEDANEVCDPIQHPPNEVTDPSPIIAVEHCYSKSALEGVVDVSEVVQETKNDGELNVEESITLDPELDIVKQEDICADEDDGFGFTSVMMEVVEQMKDDQSKTVSTQIEDSDSESESETSDSDSDSTSSGSSLEMQDTHRNVELTTELKNSVQPNVTKEILPTVEELNVVLPDKTVLEAIGKVSQIISNNTVVIKAYENKPALDCETVLFFNRNLAIGMVEEIFGPVCSPFYAVMFNGPEHIKSKQVELNKEVFYAPFITKFTTYVFVSELKRIKGSDASWTNDQEPPPGCVEYSDDEQERAARKQKKNKNENQNAGSNSLDNCNGSGRGRERGRGRGTKRDRWHNNRIKVNNPECPSESQAGWQAAVSNSSLRSAGNSQPRFGNPAFFPHSQPNFTAPPTLFNCFQTPPPPLPPEIRNFRFPMGNFQPPPPPMGNFPPPFPQNPFQGMQSPQSQGMMDYCNNDVMHFAQPPPPPPDV